MLDGTISDGEWDDATTVDMSRGGKLWLKHDGDAVYVALRGADRAVGSICIATGEKSIRVLHASSALGTAVFEARKGDKWTPVTDFSWTLRESELTESLTRKRGEFYEAHGWVASNMDTGARPDMEYRIALKPLGEAPTLAVAYARLGDEGLVVESWPGDLADGCADLELVGGEAPSNLSFDPAGWARLSLE